MRISDWSSDVCASVLGGPDVFGQRSDACIALFSQCAADPARGAWLRCRDWGAVGSAVRIAQPPHSERGGYCERIRHAPDRKSVVVGKEGVGTCRSRGSPYHYKTKKNYIMVLWKD